MAGEQGNNNGPAADGGKDGDESEKSSKDDGFKPVTYKTQDELNAAFADRATRAAEAAKAETLKPFLEKGVDPDKAIEVYETWKAEEDKKKSPEALANEKYQEVQRKLQAYEEKEARSKLSAEVAKDLKIGETPIPAELLAGSTKEELMAHGQALVAFISAVVGGKLGPRAPGYNPDQGHGSDGELQTGDPIRNLFMTGQFQ